MKQSDIATARAHRDWLRSLPSMTGLALSRIADDLKIARSTLTKPLKKSDPGKSTLHAATIDKITGRFGILPPAVAGGAALPGPRGGLAEDASPYVMDEADPLASAVRALIGGRNAVTPWTLKTRSIELAGFLPGDIVLVDLNATPRPGDAVCGEIYDWTHRKAAIVMRIFHRASPVDLLLTHTAASELQQPVVVDGEKVIIKGVLLPHRLRQPAHDEK